MAGISTGSPEDRVIIVGGGLAGLATALCLAPLPVLLVTEGRLGHSGSSIRAQGGIACALDHDDLPALHAADTAVAGGGLSDRHIVQRVTNEAPKCITLLRQWGVHFDEGANGKPALTREGAHGRQRILHAGGDRTGQVLMCALEARVRAAVSIEVAEETKVVELLVNDGVVGGVLVQRGTSATSICARSVVLATGGAAALYASTTNPQENWGSGLHLAARVGARLRDLEFVQFHPTALDLPDSVRTGTPLPLVSEAIRGEGGVLVDDTDDPVMSGVPGGDLASRDKVARVLWHRLRTGRQVFLDTRDALGEKIVQRFPAVTALCRAAGIDPVTQPIPVRPAAHYHMGGIRTDACGATSVSGLWAVGEVASTGLHGANRLASNSLLEAVAFAAWAAQDIRSRVTRPRRSLTSTRLRRDWPDTKTARADDPAIQDLRMLMDAHIGVLRDGPGLKQAMSDISALRTAADPQSRGAAMCDIGLMIAQAALTRQESRGSHTRLDFEGPSAAWARHQTISLAAINADHSAALPS